MRLSLLFLLIFCTACTSHQGKHQYFVKKPLRENHPIPPKSIADTFQFPVGKPPLNGYYNAQGFGKNRHLGDDWNGLGGGNSDLGDPVYCIGNGEVVFADDHGVSWGNVVRIVHHLPDGEMVESLYAHLDTVLVKVGDWPNMGQQIGTIGTADGYYPAHLHFEMRSDITLPIGPGYSTITKGYLNPTTFICNWRKQ